VPPWGRERSGGAARLTGRSWAQPGLGCADDLTASRNAEEPLGSLAPIPWPLLGHPRRLLLRPASLLGNGGCPAPESGTHGRTRCVEPSLGLARYEGTEMFRGRRGQDPVSLPSPSRWGQRLHTCVGQTPCVWAYLEKSSQHTLSEADDARTKAAEKRAKKSAPRGRVSLDNRGPHKG
jgi:hypothetical protein